MIDEAMEDATYGAREMAPRASIQDTVRELLEAYERPLIRFVSVLLTDEESARDCVQETFVKAFTQLSKGKEVNSRWLYKVARNGAIDVLRARKREPERALELERFALLETVAPIGPHVRAALAMLSPQDREILYLAEVDGFNSVEIAGMLGIRAGTVRMRLCRAHLRFRQAYGAPE